MSGYYLICSLILWTKYCYYSELQRRKPWQAGLTHVRVTGNDGQVTAQNLRVSIPVYGIGMLTGSHTRPLEFPSLWRWPRVLRSLPNSFVLFGFKVLFEHGVLPP